MKTISGLPWMISVETYSW